MKRRPHSQRAPQQRTLPPGAIVIMPDGRVLRVAPSGELVAVVQGGFAHGEMATEPIATRRP